MDRWWEADSEGVPKYGLINGVFKGGGARGAAYAGALEAVERAGLWFNSVAGASAGAITAALIAAGARPGPAPADTNATAGTPTAPAASAQPPPAPLFSDASDSALGSVRLALPRAILGRRDSLFDAEPLHDWLAELLRTQCGFAATHGLVTFLELFEHSGIELFVVAMDLNSRAPVVFHRATTPNVSVASAVVASCAIPGALPSGRMCTVGGKSLYVDQLVDGGSWANFPVFVYKDRLFRSWLARNFPDFNSPSGDDADDAGTANVHPYASTVVQRPKQDPVTIGFVLGKDEVHEFPKILNLSVPKDSRRVDEFDRGSAISSGSTAQHVVAAFLGRWSGRLAIVLGFGIWLWLSTTAYPQTSRRWMTTWAGINSGGLWPVAAFVEVTIVLFIMLAVAIAVIVAVIFGNALGKLVIPAAFAALGVATGTPPWIREHADRFAAFVVPCDGLSTIRFKPDPNTVREANVRARLRVAEQLRSAIVDSQVGLGDLVDTARIDRALEEWREPPQGTNEAAAATNVSASDGTPRRSWLRNPYITGAGLFVSSAVGLGCMGGAFWLLERSSYASPWTLARALGWGIPLTTVGAAGVLAARRYRRPIGHLGWALIILGLAMALSSSFTARKGPYVVGAFLLAVTGTVLVVVMLTRASSRAHRRAIERPGPWAVPAVVLLLVGIALIVSAVFVVRHVSSDIDKETDPATLISVIDDPVKGIQETYCVGPTRPRCADSITIPSTKSAYRVGDKVLLRGNETTSYSVETIPHGRALLIAVAMFFAGLGIFASGRKQSRYLKRLKYEGAKSQKRGERHQPANPLVPAPAGVAPSQP